jgi:hypothetical protein
MPTSHLSEATLIRNAAIKAKYDFSNMTGEAIYNSFDDSALQVGYLAGDILNKYPSMISCYFITKTNIQV